jgi:hypothetical protein
VCIELARSEGGRRGRSLRHWSDEAELQDANSVGWCRLPGEACEIHCRPVLHGKIDAPATASLGQDSGDVTLHRPRTQAEALPDFSVGEPLPDEVDYLLLASGQGHAIG